MAGQTRPRLARAIAVLGEAYRQTVTATTIRAYELGLQGVPDQAVEDAVAQAIKTRRFMATASELRELAGELAPEGRAAKAWAVVQRTVCRHDYYETVQFDDPFTMATIRNLWRTWAEFCAETERTEEKWLRKDFERVYLLLWRAGITQRDAEPLVGAHDLTNAPRGLPLQATTFVAVGLPAPAVGVLPGERKLISNAAAKE